MKNMLKNILIVTVAFISLLFVNCKGKTTQAKSQAATDTLPLIDDAIKTAVERIVERVTTGSKIAVLNFKSPTNRFSEYIISELEANLFDNGKVIVIDRKDIELIRDEMVFQMSGEVSDESIQAAGQRLGAQSIVTGHIINVGDAYRMVVRVVNVKTSAVEVQYRSDIKNDNRVQTLLAGGRRQKSTTASPQVNPTANATATLTNSQPSVQTAPALAATPQSTNQTTVIIVPQPTALPQKSVSYPKGKMAYPKSTAPRVSASINIATMPPQADIYINGKFIGKSNIGELQVPVGTYPIRFIKDHFDVTKTVTIKPGVNPSLFVSLK